MTYDPTTRHSDDFWTDNQAVILAHILRAELVYLNAHNHIAAERGFFGMAVKDGAIPFCWPSERRRTP